MGFIGVQPASAPLTASDITDGIISNAKLGADSVNASKVADDSISEEHLDITAITGHSAITSLADTDKFLVSDASDSNNLKYVEKQYLGGSNLVRTQNASGTDLYLANCFSNTYESYIIFATILNTGTDNTFINMRFRDTSGNVMSADRNLSFVYTLGSGSTSTSVISQDTASGNTLRLSVGDDINEAFNYQINISRRENNHTFYNYIATTEDWTNGKSQSIKGGGKFANGTTEVFGVDFTTNAGTSIAGSAVCFGVDYS